MSGRHSKRPKHVSVAVNHLPFLDLVWPGVCTGFCLVVRVMGLTVEPYTAKYVPLYTV